MIKIYFKPGCKYCDTVKSFLNSRNIKYESIDLAIGDNRDARKFYRSLGINTLPVIVGHIKEDEVILYGDCVDSLNELDETK